MLINKTKHTFTSFYYYKKLSIVASAILVLGLSVSLYADVNYEHAVKTPSGVESSTQDMSKMKASGKCGTDHGKATRHNKSTTNKAYLELERAIKIPSSVESPYEDILR